MRLSILKALIRRRARIRVRAKWWTELHGKAFIRSFIFIYACPPTAHGLKRWCRNQKKIKEKEAIQKKENILIHETLLLHITKFKCRQVIDKNIDIIWPHSITQITQSLNRRKNRRTNLTASLHKLKAWVNVSVTRNRALLCQLTGRSVRKKSENIFLFKHIPS